MKRDRLVRGIAGSLTLLSVILTLAVNPLWIYLAGFVGVMLFFSFATNICPMMILMKKFGIGEE